KIVRFFSNSTGKWIGQMEYLLVGRFGHALQGMGTGFRRGGGVFSEWMGTARLEEFGCRGSNSVRDPKTPGGWVEYIHFSIRRIRVGAVFCQGRQDAG